MSHGRSHSRKGSGQQEAGGFARWWIGQAERVGGARRRDRCWRRGRWGRILAAMMNFIRHASCALWCGAGVFAALGSVACGPEVETLPPTGVYQFEAETIENACDPRLDDDSRGEELVVVSAEELRVASFDYLGVDNDCESCVASTSWVHFKTIPGMDGLYVEHEPLSRTSKGCEHRQTIEVEITGEDSLLARMTSTWRDVGGCEVAGATAEGCVVVREYTHTLVEPCDDCEFPIGESP